jgi:hypothetical protein
MCGCCPASLSWNSLPNFWVVTMKNTAPPPSARTSSERILPFQRGWSTSFQLLGSSPGFTRSVFTRMPYWMT